MENHFKMKKIILHKSLRLSFINFALLFAAVPGTLLAQHNTGTPQYGYYGKSAFEYKVPFANTDNLLDREQMLYSTAILKDLTTEAKAPSGNISKVYLHTKPGAAKVYNMKNVLIKMGQTTDTTYPNVLNVPFKPCTEVFNQANYTVSSPGWIEFELPVVFAYDNTKTLVVEVSGDAGFATTYTQRTSTVIMGKYGSSTGDPSGLHDLKEFGFDIGFPSSVGEATMGAVINVYPNPATDVLHISSGKDISGVVSINDMTGRTVLQEDFNGKDCQVSVASFPNGMYFYKVVSKDGFLVRTGKITVSH